jgi:putative heme-binding domain-containing protein
MAIAPDGSLYFGDWVLRDYPVHGKGRIWRLTLPAKELQTTFPAPLANLVADANHDGDEEEVLATAASDDPFARAQVVWHLAQSDPGDPVIGLDPLKLCLSQAARWRGIDDSQLLHNLLGGALRDKSADVRLYAVRWIADERITALRDDVAKLLEGPQPSARYYLAVLAAIDWLDHEPKMRTAGINEELLVRELKNLERTPQAHAQALRLLTPDSKYLTEARLRRYLRAEYQPLRLEAVRTIAQRSDPGRFDLLAEIFGDKTHSDPIRAEAFVGLSAAGERFKEFALNESSPKSDFLLREAKRSLRLAGLEPGPPETKPPADDLAAWAKLLATPGDADAGRRIFFGPVGSRCCVCHTYDGRGGSVGPDLTHIGRNTKRDRIIASILQPSQEIAPEYQPWILVTEDGKTHTGLRLPQGGDNGIERYTDSAGNEIALPSETIQQRHASSTSIMPDNLTATLSIQDLRDLVSFLTASE